MQWMSDMSRRIGVSHVKSTNAPVIPSTGSLYGESISFKSGAFVEVPVVRPNNTRKLNRSAGIGVLSVSAMNVDDAFNVYITTASSMNGTNDIAILPEVSKQTVETKTKPCMHINVEGLENLAEARSVIDQVYSAIMKRARPTPILSDDAAFETMQYTCSNPDQTKRGKIYILESNAEFLLGRGKGHEFLDIDQLTVGDTSFTWKETSSGRDTRTIKFSKVDVMYD
tara:strand:+ start:1650 stop:2327 length:678 start_codon:yes stop_codon:yes gene_type:complete